MRRVHWLLAGSAIVVTVVLVWLIPWGGSDAAEFVHATNLGKAHLENRNASEATRWFAEAVELKSDSAPAQRNLARAWLLARKPKEALEPLAKAAALESESASTSYLAGLANLRLNQFDAAIAHFSEAVRIDPQTATLRFQLASALESANKHDEAVVQIRETIRLDPLHASGHYKLSNYARRSGDREEFLEHLGEFMRLRKIFGDVSRSPVALETCLYTQAETADSASPRQRDGDVKTTVTFVDASDEAFVEATDRSAVAAALLEISEDGRYSLFVVDSDGATALLTCSASGVFQRTNLEATVSGGVESPKIVMGNFHDDVPKGVAYDAKVHALPDVLVIASDRLQLLKQVRRGVFEDVTASANLEGLDANGAAWIDYEHDGDLDFLLARKSGLQLWQNNGDATFADVTQQVGVVSVGDALGVVGAELDGNVAVDLVAVFGNEPTLVFENQRVGRFRSMPEPPGPWPMATGITANDFDNDGLVDVVLTSDARTVVVYGGGRDRDVIEHAGIVESRAVPIDFDNDGWLDLFVYGRSTDPQGAAGVQMFRSAGNGQWSNETAATGLGELRLSAVRDAIPADFDGDGDSDLLLVTDAGRLTYLRNDGGHAGGQLKIRPIPLKTNPSGFGTHVELRAGDFMVSRYVGGPAVELGLGGRRQVDTVRLVWTNGVVDNQIEVALTPPVMTIAEKNVATGSCPFLYAWDGRGYRFVTDILGNSPVGLSYRRGAFLPADPDESVYIGDEASFVSREGLFYVDVTEEFREVLYLDFAKLIVVDHDEDVEIHSTDKLMRPPFPVSELWALRNARLPITAVGDDGIDRTQALQEIDGRYAPAGPPLPPPFRGTCHPLTLTLNFGAVDAESPLVLALTGWLQYGDASTNIALSQSKDVSVIPPTLQAEDEDGQWRTVEVVVGMPAGKTKTILVDLSDRLPSGVQRLRLTTTFEIRWDRIALFERTSISPDHQVELLPSRAELRWRGFSELQSRQLNHPTTPRYDAVAELPPWRTTPEGWCTRYGDVLPLVTEQDDRLAILNAGDAVELGFDASHLPPLSLNKRRSFFFYSFGWDKDGDHNVADGETVGPLPKSIVSDPAATDNEAIADWELEYNTRWVPRDFFDQAP